MPEAIAVAPRQSRLKNIIGGSAGNLVEWFDWYVYGSFALYFASAFFPERDQTAQLLQTAAIFAVGFLMRPIGAWLMGIYADHRGRKEGLTLSVSLMCAGSLMIALAPTYAQAGLLSPAILLIARMVQGLSLGGEYGSSATYMSEIADRDRRGFWSSFLYVTIIGGQLSALALLVILQAVLGEDAMQAWGWRIGFFAGALLAIVVFFIRRGLDETLSYENIAARSERRRSSLVTLFRDHPREALLVIGITAGGTATFYAFTVYMQKFLVNTSGFSRPTATMIMTVALVIFMLIQPWWGMAADRWGRKPMLYVFGFGGMLVSVPIYSAISVVTAPLTALALVLVPLVILGSYTSISGLIKAELFPAHIRTLGVALPYAVGNTLFGGTAEYVALWFKQAGMESGFYWYLSAVIGMAAIGFLMLPETKTKSLILED